jgi:CheY-like chemotaxis protein
MTGLELLLHLRQIGRSIPIIIMTGFDRPKLRETCLQAGASAYLLKPIDRQALVAAVDEAIGWSSQADLTDRPAKRREAKSN